MKNVLYVDRAFKNELGGDKNRSRYLYNTLQENSHVFTCIITDGVSTTEDSSESLRLSTTSKKSFLQPDAIASFSNKTKALFVDFIVKHEITDILLRSIAFSALALYAKKRIPSLNIMIDADLILSRLMAQAWKKQRSLSKRYYLIQKVKLSWYEKRLYNNPFTFLFTNKEECNDIQKSFPNCNVTYLPNTTDLIPKTPVVNTSKVILFYGAMDSTANQDAYHYIQHQLYPKIKETLELHDYEIHIVGKGCETLSPSKHKRIQVIGKVDSIEETIDKSAFVLLPIYIASGTNTRVIEVAMRGRPLITTPLGMEGLSNTFQEYVASDVDDMCSKVNTLIENKTYGLKLAQTLQQKIASEFSYANFQNILTRLLQEKAQTTSLMHIPRRFTHNAWGGTETVIMNSAKYLQMLGYRSTIYTSKALDTRRDDTMDGVSIKRFNYFYPFFNLGKKQKEAFDSIGGNLFSFSLLFALLRRKDIDVIHLHTLKRLGGIARSVAKWRKIPYVITLHGGYFDIHTEEVAHRQQHAKKTYEWGKVLGWLVGSRKVMDDAAAIITLSKDEYKKANEKYGNKVHYLSNGVDIERFSRGDAHAFKRTYNIPSSKKVILCSARIDTQKNQRLLLEAFHQLHTTDNTLHLVLLGAISDNKYMRELKDYMTQHNLEKNVTMIHDLSPRDDALYGAYKAASILVLPSRHEPFGMVVLEAWAAGIPVVASHTGGLSRIITHEHNGLLFKNGNLTELTTNMANLLQDETLQQKLIENAYSDIEPYDWRHIAKELDTLYTQAVHNN
jgi:glycosyltransferase involved in cell wall biosynthesis